MKNILQLALCVGLLLSTSLLSAQAITFTTDNSLLNPGSGSSKCVVDMNGDFLDDVVRTSSSGLTIDYQQADGSYTQNFFAIPFQNSPSWSICAGDIDNNGFNDLLFGGGSAVSFVKANDDGSAYNEVLMPDYIFSQRSTFSDIDNDGNLDAFVCHDVDQSHPFRNDGNGNLTIDQSLIATLDMPGNYAAIWTDYDNDGDQDLYMTKCKLGSVSGDVDRTNRMYQNDGTGNFTEVAEAIGVGDNAQSWATVVEDFDNDGDMDMFIVNHDFANRFYRNNGDGTFTDIIADTGIQAGDLGAWEAFGADFNNDGYMDIMAELNNSIYYGNGDLTFTAGSSPSPGGTVGDLNNDGFMDILSSGGTAYLNDGNDYNWFKLNTVGIESNRNGIGCRVELHGAWGTQIREVRAGQSFSPMHSMAIHFGIGEATEITKAVVKWPSGLITEVDNPAINSMIDVYESGCYLGSFETMVNGSTTKCPNEMVELIAPDGYTSYEWNNGSMEQVIQVFDPGNYVVTVTDDEGCIGTTLPIAINNQEETYPVIEAPNGERACIGESITLTALAEDPLWSDGQSGISVEVTTSGSYYVTVPGACIAELESNTIDVSFLSNDTPEIADITLPGGPQDVMVTAIGDSIQWYDDANGDNLIATGNEFTAYVETQAEYYLNNTTTHGGEQQDGGKPDNAGGGGLPSTGAVSYFDTYEPFTIKEVTVYVLPQAIIGTRTVNLIDANGAVLATKSFDLMTEGAHTLALDFEVPVGNQFGLQCAENNLFRNSSGVNYPYPIGDVGELNNSGFGQNYYYYFYNWKIEKLAQYCTSEIVDVQLSVTAIDEIDYVDAYEVFPNPANNQLFVQFNASQSADGQLELMDALGRLMQSQQVAITNGANRLDLNVAQLPAGMYQLNLRAKDGVVTRKVIIE